MVRIDFFMPHFFSQTNSLGIDLDWEYPNSPGAGQPYRAADAANLLLLIQLLRAALGMFTFRWRLHHTHSIIL